MGVHLWADQARGQQQNHATMMRPAAVPTLHQEARELFIAAYGRFADRCREADEPGLAIVAVEETTGRAAGLVRLSARVERHVAAIVGRHDECDLYLTGSQSLALRHLAIILDPVTSWKSGDKTVRFRVLDLRTGEGFRDEEGRVLRGLKCEGPAVLRCAGYAIFVLPLGDPTDWPQSASDAWACLPERVYFDEVDNVPANNVRANNFPQGSMPRMMTIRTSPGVPIEQMQRKTSTITRTHGPRDSAISMLSSDGDLAGTLELTGHNIRERIRIGHRALGEGVLLGRYARCDGAGGLAEDGALSRVHAMLIQVDDTLLLIDTASSNGIWESGERPRARVFVLGSNTELILGKTTRIRWRWVG